MDAGKKTDLKKSFVSAFAFKKADKIKSPEIKLTEVKDEIIASPAVLPALPESILSDGPVDKTSLAETSLEEKQPLFTIADGASFAFLLFAMITCLVYPANQADKQIAAAIKTILALSFTVALTVPHTIWFREFQDRVSRLRLKSQRRARLNKLSAIHPIIIFMGAGITLSIVGIFLHVLQPFLMPLVIIAAYGLAIKWLTQVVAMPFEIAAIMKGSDKLSDNEKQRSTWAAGAALTFSLLPIALPLITVLATGGQVTITEHPFLLFLSIALTGGSFVYLRNMLLKTTPSERLETAKPDNPVQVEEGDVDFKYNDFVELTKFIRQKVAMRSPWKIGVLLAILLAAVACNLHTVILAWITQIMVGSGVASAGVGLTGDELANPLAHLNALANSGLVFSFVVLTGLGMIFGLRSYVRAPKRFAVGKGGVKVLYWKDSGLKNIALDWQDMRQIKLIRPKGKASALSDRLVFERLSGPPVSIKLAGLGSSTEKEKLLAAIDRYGPQVSREAAVEETLRKPMERNYTELWLQALAAPPKRERLKPMIGGAMLNEGRFEVARELGVGGQGFAYLARDTRSGLEVVLKEFVLPVFVDINARRQSLENFEKEAKLLSSLEHPQVVKLEGFFVEDHRAYLVLEHIDGENLRQIVERDGPMPEARIRELAAQMCEILVYLHGLAPPLVHRDFTPDNLILRKDGTLKLIDFNVAQQVEVAVTGTVVGKQAYLPPEQFRGQAAPASDLYAFGATLYFLAGGKDPTPISVAKPIKDGLAVSARLDALISSLTQMEAAMRPLSARAVAETLAHQHGDEDGQN